MDILNLQSSLRAITGDPTLMITQSEDVGGTQFEFLVSHTTWTDASWALTAAKRYLAAEVGLVCDIYAIETRIGDCMRDIWLAETPTFPPVYVGGFVVQKKALKVSA